MNYLQNKNTILTGVIILAGIGMFALLSTLAFIITIIIPNPNLEYSVYYWRVWAIVTVFILTILFLIGLILPINRNI